MKMMISFIRKEFFHIFRDKRTMLILIGIPIVQLILFGFAISNEVKNVKFAVLTPHYTSDVYMLIEKIDANDYFKYVGACENINEAEKLLTNDKADVVIQFEDKFDKKDYRSYLNNVSLIINSCDPNMASSEGNMLNNIIRSYFNDGNSSLNISSRLLYNPRMESSYNFVPGIMGMILMVICAMMTSISIVREKETGTMEVLLVSPTKPLSIVFAKMVPYFALSCVNLATILLLSVFVLKLPIAGNFVLLIGVSMLYILLALSFGLLISTLMDKQVNAMLASVMILLFPTILLSGLMYPIENLPEFFRIISSVIPARWYISAMRKIMIQGLSIEFVWKEIVILLGMFLLITSVSIAKYKKRLE